MENCVRKERRVFLSLGEEELEGVGVEGNRDWLPLVKGCSETTHLHHNFLHKNTQPPCFNMKKNTKPFSINIINDNTKKAYVNTPISG